jgi:hypothetical protein
MLKQAGVDARACFSMLWLCQTPISVGGDATAPLPEHFPNFHKSLWMHQND